MRKRVIPYLFILPQYVVFIIFFVFPVIMAIYISFCKWDLVSLPSFVGFENYMSILFKPDSFYFKLFWSSLKNTLMYVLISVPLLIIVPLILAIMLTSIKKGVSLFQSIFYFPYLLSVATVVLTWRWLLDKNFGIINKIFNIDIGWTVEEPYFWVAVVVMSLWWGLGGNMIIFIAGIKGIPETLYDAAKIDGANMIYKFLNVTLPGLKEQILYTFVITTIASFNIYGQPLMLANTKNLTSDKNTLLIAIQQTTFGSVSATGMATAMALILGVILFSISLLQFRIYGKDMRE